MSRRPTYLSREFAAKLAKLESTRVKVENLLPLGHLSDADVEVVYAGLFLDAFTEFESLIESLFLGLFDGSLKSNGQPVARLLRVSPKSAARTVVFGGKSYMDWLPVEDKTIPHAKRYLFDGRPFSLLSQSEKLELKNAHLLRNAIAHKSDAATQGFLRSISQQSLLPHEKSPAGYLRTNPQGTAGLTRFTITMQSLEAIAKKVCA